MVMLHTHFPIAFCPGRFLEFAVQYLVSISGSAGGFRVLSNEFKVSLCMSLGVSLFHILACNRLGVVNGVACTGEKCFFFFFSLFTVPPAF
jgi:hypothetical protein